VAADVPPSHSSTPPPAHCSDAAPALDAAAADGDGSGDAGLSSSTGVRRHWTTTSAVPVAVVVAVVFGGAVAGGAATWRRSMDRDARDGSRRTLVGRSRADRRRASEHVGCSWTTSRRTGGQ